MTIDFDRPVDRSQSHSLKYEVRQQYFGRDDVIPLWVADMDFAAPQAVTDALVARARHPVYGYSVYPQSMYQALQQWCDKHYDWHIANRKSIVMCPGVVASLHAAIEALSKPGDKVIVQPPVYYPFFTAVTETGRELVLNPLQLTDGEYRMDLAHLQQCAEQGAKLLLLCSPHNPVGRVWRQQELHDLLNLARRYDMTIISDEIHADLIYPGYRHIALATLTEDVPVVTALSASKTFNIPGLGLSALVVEQKNQRKAIQQVLDSWHISASNPFSVTAFEAAYCEGEPWLEALMPYLAETRDWVSQFIETELPAITLIESQGTYLLWLDCRALGLDDAALKKLFVEQAGVGLSQGIIFGDAGSGFMRMNIAAPRALIQRAWQQIAAAVKKIV